MSCPDEILHLVERFTLNLEAYRSGQYNETQLRREFLDPFFTALGWDVENKQGYAEAYKDVIHEDAIKVGGATKAPDYCFRIGGTRKFFVEAKKPSVNLRDEISPAYQLRRYAWSAKLPLSILTDFDEFAVYDCRVKPGRADTAATARTLYAEFKEYPERWEEIASIFSRDAVLKGSFDRYAKSTKAKKGTAEVDDAFLKEIEAWRDTLARSIALRNTELTQRELNFAVQRTIDRMIFLRICEDRGIETYGALMALLNGEHVYKRLCELFHRADEKYNSGLFHFRQEKDRLEEPDELTLGLSIDDKPLKEIIRNLYYPDSPYEFSVLPADILGQVYEQFLGKVIRLTAGHRAVVEDKPEVKKAGGVYYTPTYIVDYIVKNTVGKLLEAHLSPRRRGDGGEVSNEETPSQPSPKRGRGSGLTPKHVSELRILDPACGSGSFLIGAYQYLLDWHRDWYVNDDPNKWATGRSPALYQVSGGDWRLTTAERKRILLNNIYGVDIDPQAVEVTKLSLLLKVLEGENEQTISRQLKMFHERALPDLGSNIKCGNSLIGPDFYEGKQLSLMDDEERLRINVFDWKKEFPDVFAPSPQGEGRREVKGFDAVIGNPPYLKLTLNNMEPAVAKYYEDKYRSIHGGSSKNLFQLFIERSLLLARREFSFIVPEAILTTSSNGLLRRLILEEMALETLVVFDDFVFPDATIGSTIFVLAKPAEPKEVVVEKLHPSGNAMEVKRLRIDSPSEMPWETASQDEFTEILDKMVHTSQPMKELVQMSKGMVVQDRKMHLRKKRRQGDLPFVLGNSMARYSVSHEEYTNYEELTIVGGTKSLERHIQTPRLLIRRTGDILCAAYSSSKELIESTVYILTSDKTDLKFLLGMLNSRLLTFFLKQRLLTNIQGFPQVLMSQLDQLPIRTMNFSDPADKARHDRMVEKVEEMLALHKQLASAKTEHEKTALQRQIDATDKQIDQLVDELYGLTEEEIKIVEGK
jgi:type I restriction-modification system DNA methylase subunit/predicted type IV restriction endonuclease